MNDNWPTRRDPILDPPRFVDGYHHSGDVLIKLKSDHYHTGDILPGHYCGPGQYHVFGKRRHFIDAKLIECWWPLPE